MLPHKGSISQRRGLVNITLRFTGVHFPITHTMDQLVPLFYLWMFVGPIIALVIAKSTNRRIDDLEYKIREMKGGASKGREPMFQPTPSPAQVGDPSLKSAKPETEGVPTHAQESETPPPLPSEAFALPEVVRPPFVARPSVQPFSAPRPVSSPPPTERKPAVPEWNLEQFMGVKLFAWVGGLALFLGIVFFVKYAFERNLIPAGVRTMIGFVIGLALMVGGVIMKRRAAYQVLAQTLCATGVLILYGVTFAAHALYKLPPFESPMVTFFIMALITLSAFTLAVRMDAQVVAVLGMIGGFLTPILCSTGVDRPFELFSYIALLDIGVLAVAKRRRWLYLTALAAGGTMLMQFGWFGKFFQTSGYARGDMTLIPMGILLGFAGLFTLAAWRSRQRDDDDAFPAKSALALCGGAMVAAFGFLACGTIADRPFLLYGFVFAINALVMAIVWQQPRVVIAQIVIAILTSLHLTKWTMSVLTNDLLPQALVIYLVFGILHTAFAILWARRKESAPRAIGWTPVISLVLLLMPMLCLDSVSFAIWPAILLVDLLIIGLALSTRLLTPVLAALGITLLTAGVWLFRLPVDEPHTLMPFLTVVGGFAVFFGIASSFLNRRIPNAESGSYLPISSAVLPFTLLIMATLRLRVDDPSPVFGLALLLAVFLLGLARVGGTTVLVPTALGCVLALEWVWHERQFSSHAAVLPLLWYLGFYTLFTVFPLVFQKFFSERRLPWVASAAAGIGTFWLVYRLIQSTWPNEMMGLLPAGFAIAPALLLLFVLKRHATDNPARLSQLAWFGGVTLLFITLIFPIQFHRQWITLGWALEGAALCWMFRRVPHPGLWATGLVLLGVAFIRLAVNPAVLSYQSPSATPILNWQLYTYSVAAGAMFAGARALQPPRDFWHGFNLRGVLYALGGILLFLLLNIEIADAFTPAGSRSIVFEFDGNLARDMTYTISWALFALALLGLGFWKRLAPTRYAGIGLLALALLKLFLHDLANIDSIYRIGALVVVAVIALLASFLYQRFSTADPS